MKRTAEISRTTSETRIEMQLNIDGTGECAIDTGIAFLDHMLTLFSAHGFFDLRLKARGDLAVDSHHTVEDVGLVLGSAWDRALGDRKGIRRFGFAAVPMDEAMATVTLDLSRRPYLVYSHPEAPVGNLDFNLSVATEFFRAFAVRGGMNLHIQVAYGENEHHMLEAVFKAMGRALDQACGTDGRSEGVPSTKGIL